MTFVSLKPCLKPAAAKSCAGCSASWPPIVKSRGTPRRLKTSRSLPNCARQTKVEGTITFHVPRIELPDATDLCTAVEGIDELLLLRCRLLQNRLHESKGRAWRLAANRYFAVLCAASIALLAGCANITLNPSYESPPTSRPPKPGQGSSVTITP